MHGGPAIIPRTAHTESHPAGPVRGRFRASLWWGAAIALAAAALMFCYLRIAGTTPVVSDGAANAMQAWEMMHGDPLLHGWYVTDVSFYTTELPEYMLVEAIAGLRPEVVHICAALTYTLLVLLAAAAARGRARGAEGAVRALLAAGVMLAPQPGDATGILLTEPDHVGAAVPVLLVLLLLDWARPRWYVPAAVFAVLAVAIVGEPLTLVVGVLPVVAVCLARGCAALVRKVPLRSLWYEFSLACAAALAVPAATAANHLIVALHGYATNKNPATLQPLSVLPGNIPMTVRSVLAMFGADVWGARGGLDQAFAAIHLAGAALVVVAIAAAGWRLARTLGSRDAGDLVADLLVVAIAANVAAYFFFYEIKHIYAAHEIGPVVSLGAALAGRMLGPPLSRARPSGARPSGARPSGARRSRAPRSRAWLVPALAAGLACYCVMLGFTAARPQAAPANAAVTGWLTRHSLRSGIAPYWDATSVTVDSGGAIAMGSVVPARGGLAPWHWEEDMRLFGRGHRADFLLTLAGETVTPALAVHTFGPPARVYHFQAYTIMVWRKNLLPHLGRPVS